MGVGVIGMGMGCLRGIHMLEQGYNVGRINEDQS